MSKWILVFIILLGLVSTLTAQRRTGSGQGTGRGTTNGTGDQVRDRDRIHDQTQDRDWTRDQQRDQQRLRIHATDTQQQQYNTATRSASQARMQAKEMRKSAHGNGLSQDQARAQHARLQEQVRSMQQEHARMMQGLSGEQQSAVKQRTREMDRIQERLNTRLQSMNGELQKPSPDGKRLAEHARAMENDINRWQQQSQTMASTLGMQD